MTKVQVVVQVALLQNQKANNLVTLYVALRMLGLPNFFK